MNGHGIAWDFTLRYTPTTCMCSRLFSSWPSWQSCPQGLDKLEELAVRRVAKGSGIWCRAQDLHRGNDSDLLVDSAPFWSRVGQRCLLRMHGWEGRSWRPDRIRWRQLRRELHGALLSSDFIVRAARWLERYASHTPTVAEDAASAAAQDTVCMPAARAETTGTPLVLRRNQRRMLSAGRHALGSPGSSSRMMASSQSCDCDTD